MATFEINVPQPSVKGEAATLPAPSINRELNAYIYQQLLEVQPFLSPNTQIAVTVQQKKSEFAVTLAAKIATGILKVIGSDDDVYHAVRIAKAQMIDYLAELQDAFTDSHERESQITAMMNGSQNLH